jgi:hypothetical protein
MNQSMRKKSIHAALKSAVIGWAFMGLCGIPLAVYFDLLEGWRWPPYNAIYDQMIVSIYFAVGISSTLAIKDPIKHTSFLWFLAISSFTHGGVMLYHAALNPHHINHLIGDVWILVGGLSLAIPLWLLKKYQAY